MPSEKDSKIAEEFLKSMRAGEFDNNLIAALKKLTADQRYEIVRLMAEQDSGSSGAPTRRPAKKPRRL